MSKGREDRDGSSSVSGKGLEGVGEEGVGKRSGMG